MVLEGVVTNVAAFGAFVDIGVHQDGLVHVSAMSHTFVKDPRDVVKSGDVVRVKVLEVDIPRKRISLTLRLDDEVPTGSDSAGTGNGARGGAGGGQAHRGGQSGARNGGQSGGRSGGQRTGQPGAQSGAQSGGQPGQRGGSARPDRSAPANTAIADALRRAGLTP